MLKTKKGVTLVEALVTLALTSIVLVALSMLLSTFSSQFVNITKHIKAKQSAELVYVALEGNIRYATSAVAAKSDTVPTAYAIQSVNGRLSYKEPASAFIQLLHSEAYNGFNCDVVFKSANANCIEIEIVIYSGAATTNSVDEVPSSVIYRSTRQIKLINTADIRMPLSGKVSNAPGVLLSCNLLYNL